MSDSGTITGRLYLVTCRICGTRTSNAGTKLCDRCWEIDTRIDRSLPVAARNYFAYKLASLGVDLLSIVEHTKGGRK